MLGKEVLFILEWRKEVGYIKRECKTTVITFSLSLLILITYQYCKKTKQKKLISLNTVLRTMESYVKNCKYFCSK
jgi:hypothetical protein